ncbi:MAG: LacI family DNA-binding transcriptional regulator, partial [Tistlia sp.]
MGNDARPLKKPRSKSRKSGGPATLDDSALRPTASTISALAGVAPSTVSRALKNDPSISVATRERIVALADRLGYRPNAIARSLITRRSNVVAFIMGELTNPFYSEQLDLLLELLGEREIQLMLFHVPTGRDVAEVVPMLLQYQLDACLIASVALSSKASDILAQHRLPTVMINRVPAHRHGCAALCDNEGGGAEVARLLAARGVRRPAFVAGHADASTSRDRERGFLEGLRACGLSLGLRLDGDYTIEGGFRAGLAIAEADPR